MPKKPATSKKPNVRPAKRTSSRTSKTPARKTPRAKATDVPKRRARGAKKVSTEQLAAQTTPTKTVAGSYAQPRKPAVMHAPHETSEFVLSLKPLVAVTDPPKEDAPAFRIDFLAMAQQAHDERSPLPDLERDLTLTAHDIEAQLVQDRCRFIPRHEYERRGGLIHLRSLSFGGQAGGRLWNPSMLARNASPVRHEALRCQNDSLPVCSSAAFAPPTPPKDIFAYFDFPEEGAMETAEQEDEPQTRKRFLFSNFRLPTSDFHSFDLRSLASFVAISFAFVLPLHAMNAVQDARATRNALEETGARAVSLLSAGTNAALSRDAQNAGADFKAASAQFQSAKDRLERLGAGTDLILSALPKTRDSYLAGASLLQAGRELAIAGNRLSDGYAALEALPSPTPLSRLHILKAYLSSALPHLSTAADALANVDPQAVLQTHRDALVFAQTGVPALIATLQEFETFYDLAAQLLGAQGAKRYLLVFQNNTELRPTGGFIGSFAELKIRDGVIEDLHVPGGGSYDLQGTLTKNLVAPEPLQLLTARWEFQDGNWFPDFPTSARQLMQFYTDAGGPSVDGVLAVNATFVSRLIGLLGPVDMPAYDRIIDEENFLFEAQKLVELEYDRDANRPKTFIGDLAPLLVARMIEKSSDDFLAVVDLLNTGLARKDLQLYLADEALERRVIEQGWGGEMKWTRGDSLMVVDTNLGGGKTDGVIRQEIDLQVAVAQDGTITNTLTISRTHEGIQGLLFTGVNNVDYLRVYVPKGATLLEASGFSVPDQALFELPDEDWAIDDDLAYELLTASHDPVSGTRVSEEHGKTVFGNWVQTRPGTTSTVRFVYTLPFTLDSLQAPRGVVASLKSLAGVPNMMAYSLLVQKQSGVLDRTTRVRVKVPENLTSTWASHDLDGAILTNETDKLFAILFESL